MLGSQRRQKCQWNYQPDPLCFSQVLILSLGQLSTFTHLVVSASNLNSRQVLLNKSTRSALSLNGKILCLLLRVVGKPGVFSPWVSLLRRSQWSVSGSAERRRLWWWQCLTSSPSVGSPTMYAPSPRLLEQTIIHHGKLGSPSPPLHAGQTEEKLRQLGRV